MMRSYLFLRQFVVGAGILYSTVAISCLFYISSYYTCRHVSLKSNLVYSTYRSLQNLYTLATVLEDAEECFCGNFFLIRLTVGSTYTTALVY